MDRQHDIDLINKELRDPNLTPNQRQKLIYSRSQIVKQMSSRPINEMRQRLAKAHRDGSVEEINDIRDFIKDKPKYLGTD